MNGPHLIYVADPMCSWCWGFSPVIEAVRDRFGSSLPIRLIMGGLRPGTTKPMEDEAKGEIRHHWEHVQQATGQPFEFGFFEREGFVYDTEPAARAVIAVRREGMDRALDYLRIVHSAFYAHNLDVTKEAVLAEMATRTSLDAAVFLRDFRSDDVRQETWQDFAIAQGAGIRGFPSLLAGRDDKGEYSIVTHGYQPMERILPVLARWLEIVRTGSPGS